MSETNSMRQLAASAAQATSPFAGVASTGDPTVAHTSTREKGLGVGAVQCLLTGHCQLAQARNRSHSDV